MLLIIGTAWMIDALDVALLSFIMPLLKTEWTLNSTELEMIGSVTSIGMILGTIISCLFFGFGKNVEVILVTGAFLSFFDLGAWGTLITLTPTQFPKEIRGTGMGTAQSFGRVGATIGPFLVGWMMSLKMEISAILSLFVILLLIAIFILMFISLGDTTETI